MKTHYTCGTCKSLLEANEVNFFPSSLKKVAGNEERSVIGKCRPCANSYSKSWREGIKAKGLVRSQRTTSIMAGAVAGVVYVIGPDLPGLPYKIGVTRGTSTDNRKTSLQTSHWLELKEVWKSQLLPRADKIEKKLHKHFEKKQVRGEWFNINKQDIKDIPRLVEHFRVDE